MILHLISDEKVVNRAIAHFEDVFPDDNFVVCFSDKNTKHVKIKKNIIFYTGGENVEIDFSKIKKVIIHFLGIDKIDFCNKFVKNVPVYWPVWGGDLYNQLLSPKGYRLYSYDTIRAIGICSYFRYMVRLVKFRLTNYSKIVSFIKNRIDYVAANDGDYQLLKEWLHLPDRIKRFDLFYFPIDNILKEDLAGKEILPNSRNILCGNSASFSNNHIDTLNKIKKFKNEDSDVIMPLSYSGTEKYIQYVINKGLKIYGNKFKPLTEFIPIEQYNNILQSSFICVFSNWRQEAFGNIVMSLYLGAKIYMTKKNPLLNTILDMGCKIFALEDCNNKEEFNTPLSADAKKQNRQIIIELYNSERLHSLIKEYFK